MNYSGIEQLLAENPPVDLVRQPVRAYLTAEPLDMYKVIGYHEPTDLVLLEAEESDEYVAVPRGIFGCLYTLGRPDILEFSNDDGDRLSYVPMPGKDHLTVVDEAGYKIAYRVSKEERLSLYNYLGRVIEAEQTREG